MTKLRRACENAELAALRELMKDFPEKMRGTLKAVLAETGATREDLLLRFDPKNQETAPDFSSRLSAACDRLPLRPPIYHGTSFTFCIFTRSINPFRRGLSIARIYRDRPRVRFNSHTNCVAHAAVLHGESPFHYNGFRGVLGPTAAFIRRTVGLFCGL